MRKKRKTDEKGFNVWRSYSDMMAGILLLFVLIMCVTLFQAQKSYNESLTERDEKIKLQEEYTAEILAKQSALEEQEGQLKSQDEQLKTQDEQLKTQDEQLKTQEQLLAELAAQLKEQEEKLNLQEATLNQQQQDIDEKTDLLNEQQQKIDNIIGVKAEVVASLQKEFADNNVSVDIDSQTGALTLDANVMFAVNEAELTDEGKATLHNILPIYCKVLLQDTNKEYLAEIIIYCNNRTGLLVDITKIFTERKIDVNSVNSRTSKQGIATIAMSFEVPDKATLNYLIEKIRQVESVLDIERTTG